MIKQNQAMIRDVGSRNLVKEAKWKMETLKSQYFALSAFRKLCIILVGVSFAVIFYHLILQKDQNSIHRLVLIRSVLSKPAEEDLV
jgi:hypothetical protein